MRKPVLITHVYSAFSPPLVDFCQIPSRIPLSLSVPVDKKRGLGWELVVLTREEAVLRVSFLVVENCD